MKALLELNQIIYNLLKTQIEFGAYGYNEQLPPIDEMAELLVVSKDTIRLAYHQLQEEGYITLIKGIGTVVKVHYDKKEIEQNIQTFFSEYKDTLLDVCRSMPLLLNGIQLMAWKSISSEDLDKTENIILQKQLSPADFSIIYLQRVYGSLKNDLLMRLIRNLTITYMVPFLSLTDCKRHSDFETASALCRINFCRQEDWTAIRRITDNVEKKHFSDITYFYKTQITVPASKKQLAFTWNSYEKASQVCYTIGLELLDSIVRGVYPVGSFLPSLKKLAAKKQVSVSTIRHTLALLNDLGIVKTINGVGTQILSMDQIAENSNLSNPTVKKRLLNCKQSLQLFALSCRDIAVFTISFSDEETIIHWKEQLYLAKRLGEFDLISPISLNYMAQAAPYQTIRTVYTELYKLLFWGVPIRGMMGNQETINEFYRPYYHAMVDCLEHADAEGFAAKLEEILLRETAFVTEQLTALFIQ